MAMNSGYDREIRFEIVEHIGVLSGYSTGWNKELNLVSWNEGQPKYDIRDWSPDHAHMSRGVTLHEKEMRQIFDLMKKRRMESRMRWDGHDRRREEPFEAPLPQCSSEIQESHASQNPQDAAVCDMSGSETACDMTEGTPIEEGMELPPDTTSSF